jgi:sugar lactone lactonase YvrE
MPASFRRPRASVIQPARRRRPAAEVRVARNLASLAILLLVANACAVASPAVPSAGASAPGRTTPAGSPPASVGTPAVTPGFGAHAGPFAFGPDGALYVSDCEAGAVIRLVTPTEAVPIVEGSGPASDDFGDGGPAMQAHLLCPAGLAFDGQGRLLIADHGHNRVRRVEPDGTIQTIVGAKSPPEINHGAFSGDGGPAVDAALDAPVGLTVSRDGTLYIGDRGNDRVRDVTPDGVIHTLAGSGDPAFAAHGGDGGQAIRASLDFPLYTAVDWAGDVYITDDNHNRVRKVAPDGRISTLIGDGSFASGGDGGPASAAQVNDPQGIAIDAAGNIYVSEYGANRVRRIDPAGIVTTIAGSGGDAADAVGGDALAGDVPQPSSMAIGPDGALYIEDQDYGRILRVDLASGILSVAAGGPDGIEVVS